MKCTGQACCRKHRECVSSETGVDKFWFLDLRSKPRVPAVPQKAGPSFESYRIRVCGSVSMEGGPRVRRDGFTNTP